MVGKLVPDDKVKVDTPLMKWVLVSVTACNRKKGQTRTNWMSCIILIFWKASSMKQNSYGLEQRLLDWENKAANLKARYEQSSHDKAMQEDY